MGKGVKRNIANLFTDLTNAMDEEAKELQNDRGQLEKEREQLEEEKRRMCNFAARGNDLVKINVGGKVFQTHRATLLHAKGSMLEAVFSGRWEESLVRDELGNVFFDFDPAPFRALLNYLRMRGLKEPGQAVPLPKVPEEHKAQFEAMVSFMGLEETIFGTKPAQAVPEEAMSLSQAGSRDGGITVAGGHLQCVPHGQGDRCVIGGAPLLQSGLQEKVAWKVSFPKPFGWVFVGLCANPAPADESYSDVGAYGWATCHHVYSGGQCQVAAGGWPGWQTGDVAIFQLNAPERILRMHLRRTGTVYSLPLPAHLVRSVRLSFVLYHSGNRMEVEQVTQQDLADAGFSDH